MRHLLRLGVSGILTDFPALLRRLLNREIRKNAAAPCSTLGSNRDAAIPNVSRLFWRRTAR